MIMKRPFRSSVPLTCALIASFVLAGPIGAAAQGIWRLALNVQFTPPNSTNLLLRMNRPEPQAAVVPPTRGEPFSGSYLRGNWTTNFTDTIARIRTGSSPAVRHQPYSVSAERYGIGDEFRLDCRVRFDSNIVFTNNSIKFFCLSGAVNQSLVVQPGWNSWSVLNTSPPDQPVGEVAVAPRDTAIFTESEGAAELLQGRSTAQWFPGRWHQVQIRVKLNTPGKSDGIFQFKLDGVTVLQIRDRVYRDHSDQTFSDFKCPAMFIGPPPQSSFGWQLDAVRVWVPD